MCAVQEKRLPKALTINQLPYIIFFCSTKKEYVNLEDGGNSGPCEKYPFHTLTIRKSFNKEQRSLYFKPGFKI